MTNTAEGLISSLPHVRFGLLIGTGTGISGHTFGPHGKTCSVRRGIRLGDVVVGVPNDINGGTVQFHADTEMQSLLWIPPLNSAPEVLHVTASALETREKNRAPKISNLLSEALSKLLRETSTDDHPATYTDHLFKAAYTHVGGSKFEDCAEKETIRPAPKVEPEIHYGTIASGNRALKDAEYRDEIASKMEKQGVNPTCIDSDSIGAVNAIPFLTLRGICDYGDSHETSEWYGHAALTAAGFVKRLLSFIDADTVDNNRPPRKFTRRHTIH